MPKRPNVPCRHPGCPKLVAYGEKYCEKHKALYLQPARSADSRGYNRRWRKSSKAYLQAHPLCVKCLEEGRYVGATVVDHIQPHRGDYNLFWDIDNWQPLCKHHHDVKTMTEDRNIEYKY